VLSFIKDDKQKQDVNADESSRSSAANPSIFSWLLVAYGLEGLGYIVSATFLVAMVKQMPGMSGIADYSWIIVGIAAVPTPLLWSWWASRMDYIIPLITALILQICGVILPVCLPNKIGITLGSVLFGGTFVGITMLSIAMARMASPSNGNKVVALMTGFYGTGQILGPIGAGIVLEVTHSYSLSIILATLVLVIAATILITGAIFSNNKRIAKIKTHLHEGDQPCIKLS
jgi:MFS family permease